MPLRVALVNDYEIVVRGLATSSRRPPSTRCSSEPTSWAALPPEAGVLTTRKDRVAEAVRELLADHDRAATCGTAARAHAVRHYGLDAFLSRWDDVLHSLRSSSR